MRYAITGAIVGGIVALLLSLHAVGHSMPLAACKVPAKRWSALSLEQKERYVVCNARHARQAVKWAKTHRALYPDRGRAVVAAHRAIQRKAARNLRAIHEAQLPHTIRGIICYVWGDQCSNALAVVQCESNFDIYNQTGQYWGLFQMGEWARANYGFEWDAWQQTRGAFALYQDMGWSPWECAYIVGII